ncbi:MAG: hypothetical protein V4479_13875 [Actinomycetota bacterium]
MARLNPGGRSTTLVATAFTMKNNAQKVAVDQHSGSSPPSAHWTTGASATLAVWKPAEIVSN